MYAGDKSGDSGVVQSGGEKEKRRRVARSCCSTCVLVWGCAVVELAHTLDLMCNGRSISHRIV